MNNTARCQAMHIGIVAWSLFISRGGIQQAAVDLAHAMLERGHDVTVFYRKSSKNHAAPLYHLNHRIPLVGFYVEAYNAFVSPHETASMLNSMRESILSSGVDVLAAMFSWDALLLFPTVMRDTGVPLIISEHNNPHVINEERWNVYERHACLAAADCIHVLTPAYKAALPEFLQKRTRVIPNPAHRLLPKEQNPQTGEKIILAAGRFVDHHKMFSLLIESFAALEAQFPDWRLVLCGDGPDRKKYERLIQKLGIAGKTTIPGMVSDMSPYYKKCAFVCVPSRYEGFPLIPLEAYSYTKPVVGFSTCSGLNEIIIHGETGLLAPEFTAYSLTGQLALMMNDAELRIRFGQTGWDSLSRFAAEEVYSLWERLFEEAITAKGNTRLQRLSVLQTEEENVTMALYEILSRSSPFIPFNIRTLRELNIRVQDKKVPSNTIATKLFVFFNTMRRYARSFIK